jgi:hypothetical protein
MSAGMSTPTQLANKKAKEISKKAAKRGLALTRSDSEVARNPMPGSPDDMDVAISEDGAPGDAPEIPFDEQPTKHAKTAAAAASASSSGPASATAPAAAEVTMADIMTMLTNQNIKNTHDMQTFQSRFEEQDKKIAQIDNRFELFKAEITNKFSELRVAPPPAASASSGAQPAQRKAPWVPQAAAAQPAVSPAAGGPGLRPAARDTAEEFGRKVIVVGFPRTLPRPALVAWWEEFRCIVPKQYYDKGTFQGGHGKVFSVAFPTRADARMFTSAVATSQHNFQWVSPRVNEGSFKINFKTEKTVAERARGQALSGAWKIVSPLILRSSAFVDGMKFTTDPRRGSIAVATGNDMYELVQLKHSGGVFSIVTHDENLLHFGISREIGETIRASIAEVAASV